MPVVSFANDPIGIPSSVDTPVVRCFVDSFASKSILISFPHSLNLPFFFLVCVGVDLETGESLRLFYIHSALAEQRYIYS